MDSHYTAQDVNRCNICETVASHSFCEVYHVNLCKPCIGEHRTIIPYHERKSVIIYPKCKKNINVKSASFSARIATILFFLPAWHLKHTEGIGL